MSSLTLWGLCEEAEASDDVTVSYESSDTIGTLISSYNSRNEGQFLAAVVLAGQLLPDSMRAAALAGAGGGGDGGVRLTAVLAPTKVRAASLRSMMETKQRALKAASARGGGPNTHAPLKRPVPEQMRVRGLGAARSGAAGAVRGMGATRSIGGVRSIGGGGRGMVFADVADTARNLERMQRSAVCEAAAEQPFFSIQDGMNLEARCTKVGCPSNGQPVVCASGIGTFALGEQQQQCPACRTLVWPTTIAFTGCVWRIMRGGKIVALDRRTTGTLQVSSSWYCTPSAVYDRFRDSGAGAAAEWEWLVVQAHPLSCTADAGAAAAAARGADAAAPAIQVVELDACAICRMGELPWEVSAGAARETARCGHWYHAGCMADWRRVQTRKGVQQHTCPTCRTAL